MVAEQRRYDLWWPLNPWPWSLTDHCLPDLKSFSFMSKPVISTRLVEANVNVNLLLPRHIPRNGYFCPTVVIHLGLEESCMFLMVLLITIFVITLQEKYTLTPVDQWFGMSWVTRPGTSFAFGNLCRVEILHNSYDEHE